MRFRVPDVNQQHGCHCHKYRERPNKNRVVLIEKLGPEVLSVDHPRRLWGRWNKLEQNRDVSDHHLTARAVADREDGHITLPLDIRGGRDFGDVCDTPFSGKLTPHRLRDIELVLPTLALEKRKSLGEVRTGNHERVSGRLSDSHILTGLDQPLMDDLTVLDDADPENLYSLVSTTKTEHLHTPQMGHKCRTVAFVN